MTDYRPKPPRTLKCEARLAELSAIRRPLTDDEQREILWMQNRVRYAAKRRQRYETDAAYREQQRERARSYWAANYGYGAAR